MFVIRKALRSDAEELPAIKRSASEIFRQIVDLAWIADDTVQSIERHLDLIRQGTTWVAIDATNDIVGFISTELTGHTIPIWELAVRHDRQGRGIGRALIEKVREWAADNGVGRLTLTTFRDVPCNEGFYQSAGFKTLSQSETTPALAQVIYSEANAGLPDEKRCAMSLTLS